MWKKLKKALFPPTKSSEREATAQQLMQGGAGAGGDATTPQRYSEKHADPSDGVVSYSRKTSFQEARENQKPAYRWEASLLTCLNASSAFALIYFLVIMFSAIHSVSLSSLVPLHFRSTEPLLFSTATLLSLPCTHTSCLTTTISSTSYTCFHCYYPLFTKTANIATITATNCMLESKAGTQQQHEVSMSRHMFLCHQSLLLAASPLPSDVTQAFHGFTLFSALKLQTGSGSEPSWPESQVQAVSGLVTLQTVNTPPPVF